MQVVAAKEEDESQADPKNGQVSSLDHQISNQSGDEEKVQDKHKESLEIHAFKDEEDTNEGDSMEEVDVDNMNDKGTDHRKGIENMVGIVAMD